VKVNSLIQVPQPQVSGNEPTKMAVVDFETMRNFQIPTRIGYKIVSVITIEPAKTPKTNEPP